MKISVFIFLFLPILTFGQAKKGTIKFLVEKHGFKEIILGNDISTIKSSVVNDADSAVHSAAASMVMYRVINDDLLSVGDNIKLKSIVIGTFQGKIMSIFIKTEKLYGTNLFGTFKEAYGKPTMKPNEYIDEVMWVTKQVVLSSNMDKSREDEFVFVDRVLQDQMNDFNKNKVKKSATDI